MTNTGTIIKFKQHSRSNAPRQAQRPVRQGQTACSPDEMSLQLIAVAKDRDREAFEILFRHFSPRVRAYLVHRGSDTKNVDDILQDVFATVWQKANLYDHQRASAAAWIFTIARNRRIDALRNERRPEFDPQDPALQRNPVPGGEETFIAWQHAKTVRIALDVLSDEQREVLRLSFYEGESYSAIAVRLGIPLGTVKSRARLAFARLRTELGSKREDL